ncbi:hypothetical protein OG21DRAFT_1577133 [Imleria badia]|nr:hypothetical protein OG21DRAFT_1577133 [Imleria badia]
MAQSELPKRIFQWRAGRRITSNRLRTGICSTPHVVMTVLIGDPEPSSVCPPELLPAHPQIRRVIKVKGSSHWIQHEDPEVIVKTAVDEGRKTPRCGRVLAFTTFT